MRRPLVLALALLALAAVASGCGSSEPDGYSPEVEEGFMGGCVERALETTNNAVPRGEAEQYCSCTYDEIAAEVPFEDFADYDERVEEDESARPPAAFTAAARRCRNELGYSQGVENTFMAECVKGAVAGGGGVTEAKAKEFCRCTFADLEANVPFEVFAEYDEKSRRNPNTPTPPAINAAVDRCVADAD